jgi:dihydrofolate reductase
MMAQQTFCEISMSLDGYVAGPNADLDDPLGVGGEALHEWVISLEAWRKEHGHEGGEQNASTPVLNAALERTGAHLMGRRMFSGGEGPWADDAKANGWWGDEPPFHKPVFVVTHHGREPLTLGDTTFTFVTDGVESALDQAAEAARDKDVMISGGAAVAQQALAAGRVDDLLIHVAPLFLGGGVRLFENLGSTRPGLELTGAVDAPGVTHLTYRVVTER